VIEVLGEDIARLKQMPDVDCATRAYTAGAEEAKSHMTTHRLAELSNVSLHREIGEAREVSATADLTLRSEWLQPSDAYGWAASVRNVVPLFMLFALAPSLASSHALAPWLLSPAIGLALYRITVVMHDCTHHTLFVSRAVNARMGLLLGALSGVDFHRFCLQHWRHHRCYGRAGDPQGFQYLDLSAMTSVGLLRHLAKPLLGLKLRNVIGESLLAPRNFVRCVRSGEIVVVALVQLAVIAIVTGFGRHPLLAALPFVSGITFGLFFSQLRGIAEHGQLGGSGAHTVRSHQASWLDRVLLYDVNFNCHAEHHANPQVPSCHLPALRRAMSAPEAPDSMFVTLRDIYAERKSSDA
jgi:fatty acid desaturase